MATTKHSSPEKRWRPADRHGSTCNYTWENNTCTRRGSHYCEPRADKVVDFFADVLVHTKGVWSGQAFILEPWQEHDIIRPLFGEVVWSVEWHRYVRRYTTAFIVLARKNGKSELAAGVALYLLTADGEAAAEIYGAAKDTKQAGKVWEPAKRMRELSPRLRDLLEVKKNSRRIVNEATASFYEVITADAIGELGHNPHGVIIDEVLSQPDGSLWDSLRTAEGTRTQALSLLITTETNDPESFGAHTIDEAERVQAEPARAPHVFAYVRKLDDEADPWDESNWSIPNPALRSFLSIEAMRRGALDAQNEPEKESAFRQFKLNQRVNAATRWLGSNVWSLGAQLAPNEQDLVGALAYGGVDLSATSDLTALAWVLPESYTAGVGRLDVLWRFWLTEAALPRLDKATSGRCTQWVKQGLIELTEGDVIDYQPVWDRIELDAKRLNVADIGVDRWNSQATLNWCEANGIEAQPLTQGFALSGALKELSKILRQSGLNHGGNPVAAWCASSAEVKRRPDDEAIKLVKPDRAATSKRVDGVAALSMAIDRWLFSMQEPEIDLASQVF